MRRLEYEEALSLLERAVKERGEDYVYHRAYGACWYFLHGQPSCGVGLVLSWLGVKPEQAREKAGATITLADLRNKRILDASPSATALLLRFQYWQDQGRPWGTALASARAYCETNIRVATVARSKA
jgi:hypothetical protein